jgi:hypothetical protein
MVGGVGHTLKSGRPSAAALLVAKRASALRAVHRDRRRHAEDGKDAARAADGFDKPGFEVIGRKCTIFDRPARVLTLLKSEDEGSDNFDYGFLQAQLGAGVAECGLTEFEVLDLLTREISTDDYDVLLKLDETIPKKTVASEVLDTFVTKTGHEFAEQSCGVCLVQFDGDDVVRCLPCAHPFHDECIQEWVTKWKNTCPLCNDELPRKLDADGAAAEQTPAEQPDRTSINQ